MDRHVEDKVELLRPTGWVDYELLDSGEGAKLERFGAYVLERPEQEAIWRRSLPSEDWARADAVFGRPAGGGEPTWMLRRRVPARWQMRYRDLTFWCELTPFRHTGVFPEQAANWLWIRRVIGAAGRPVRVLNLFGYTALSTLAAAAAGAAVTYVDASRPSLAWARENQMASGLADRPIRWIHDDALKFVRREVRRGVRYDGIVMDPPVFGRGPKGEIWRFHSSFPPLLETCCQVLSPEPLFVLVNAYAVGASSTMLRNVVADAMSRLGGWVVAGELLLVQKTPAPDGSERVLSTGI